MKKQQTYNGDQPLQIKPCSGSISFDAGGNGSMIEFASLIAASMRMMAESDQLNRLRWQQQKKDVEIACCFA